MEYKKIAIMTWYTYNNYGSILQAYALKSKLADLGYKSVDIIQYIPKPVRVRLSKRIDIKNIRRKLLLRKKWVKDEYDDKVNKMNSFRNNYFSYTKRCEDMTQLFSLNNEYDKFICGSDQIWAPTLFDENYFLGFVINESKKIAYAPSLGLTSIENQYVKANIKSLINRFGSLSVREEQGKRVLEKLTDKEISVLLDPTLLLNKKEWDKKFNLFKSNVKSEYIVFYDIGLNKKHYNIAKKISKKLNKELKVIPADVLDYSKKNTENVSIEEFIRLIFNSSLVITDSFHGCIFSINFNVPFIALKRFNDDKLSQNSRIYNLLKKLKLENRLYRNNLEYFLNSGNNIDFDECNRILDEERIASVSFLKKKLSEDNKENENVVITNLCTGCGMCSVVCPQKCISIEQNEKGFYSYKIDRDKCIKCNKCKTVCGQLSKELKQLNKMKLYSARSVDNSIVKRSSSGGVGYELGRYAIRNKMPVVGCTYNTIRNIAEHVVVDKESNLISVSGSKYLQSHSLTAFSKMKNMDAGLIIGTPCQISSVDRYLKAMNKREKFILVDLICHGVPSYLLWKKYISRYKKIEKLNFRDKQYGWRKKTISVNSKYHRNEDKDLFYSFFNTNLVFNKSCYECRYRISTSADIRIGDYWGAKFKNENGVNMVIPATQTGLEVLNSLLQDGNIEFKEQNIKDYYNFQQTKNIDIPKQYDEIISELQNKDVELENISKKYCRKKILYNKLLNFALPVWRKVKEIISGQK